ncbi:MAG: Transcriptional regulator, AraC family [uncultured Acidimicrobiales bacterium]|uniref:Transcriptional regulator, AraC family n=1 Tax=uncultured Acidimicrobiales bacterium TaxID=310071 RepID=A0A6J4J605_9ACTN|nr:MAG: Transcriptional regulator, AraC family [uncultured Acidimicrobiales bacterium]
MPDVGAHRGAGPIGLLHGRGNQPVLVDGVTELEPPAYLDLLGRLSFMLHDRTLIRVEDVADLGGLTVRSLQRLFASYVGRNPKAVLARYRLQDAVAAIDAGEVDLARLAVSLGWFDQAHFSRDFRAGVGTTPSAYLQRHRASVPDV